MLYHANLPLMVLAFRDNHLAAVNVPAGKSVDVIGPADDDRFLVVDVEGEHFHAFEADVKDRCELASGRAAKA